MRQAQPGTEEYEVGTQHLKYLRENVPILQSVLTVINILFKICFITTFISELLVILMQ